MTLKQINKKIAESGIKKGKLADKLGIHRVHLSRILHGERKPKNIQKIFSNIIEKLNT